MKILKYLTSILIFSFNLLHSQNQTVTINPSMDATVHSEFPESNFENNTVLSAQTYSSEGNEYSDRFLVQFDLSSLNIPSNSYIISATLHLKGAEHQTGNGNTNRSILQYITEEWEETEVNWQNQPLVTQENQIEISETTNNSQDVQVDLTNWYRKYYGNTNELENLGFLIRLEEEAPVAKISFNSGESTSALMPELEIIYRIISPLNFSMRTTEIERDLPDGGAIDISITSGDAPFVYQWSSNVAINQRNKSEVSGLSTGDYTVTVTDGNQISFEKTIGLGYDPQWQAENSNLFKYFSNVLTRTRATNNWYGTTVSDVILRSSVGWFEYTVRPYSGRKMVGFSKADGSSADTWTGIEYGVYLDNIGNINLVTSGSQANVGSYLIGDVLRIAKNGSTFSILKNGIEITSSIRNISALNTSVYIKTTSFDTGTKLEGIRTSFNDYIELNFDLSPISKTGVDDGSLKVMANYGVPPYLYNWSNGSTSQEINNLTVGTYTVTITDANGFSISKSKLLAVVDDDWNWEEEKSYDNDGNLLSASKTYFDALQNPIQSQSKHMDEENVMVAQTIYDDYGRAVISTLSAPNFKKEFEYQTNFIEASGGGLYNSSKFDLPNTISSLPGEVDNPISVSNSVKGSVGWYYSNSNNFESHVATTQFPYSRSEYSKLTGQVRRSSSPHDAFKMGSGHEVQSYTMPVAGEMAYFFGFAVGWKLQAPFAGGAVIQNGSGRPILNLGIPDLPIFKKITKRITIDADGKQSLSFTDLDGKLVATCQANGDVNKAFNVASRITDLEPNSYVDIHLPEGCEGTLLPFENDGIVKTFWIYDLSTDERVYTGDGGENLSLNPGFYRIVDKVGEDITTIRYKLNYNLASLNYYDQLGRLLYTVSPEGFDDEFDMTGLSLKTTTRIEPFDFDPTNSQLKFSTSTIAIPSQFKHSILSNPNPIDDLQYSNIILYLAKKSDPIAVIGSPDITDGEMLSVDMNPEGEGGSGGEGQATEPIFVSSDGNFITSVNSAFAGNDHINSDREKPNGPDDDFDPVLPPCNNRPPNIKWFVLTFKVFAEHLDDNNNPTETELTSGLNKSIRITQDYSGLWGNSSIEWYIEGEDFEQGANLVERGELLSKVNGLLTNSINNTLSKTITNLRVELVDTKGWLTNPTLYTDDICPYFSWFFSPITDFQEIEDLFEMRLKVLTYNLRGDNFAPEHKVAEQFEYNTLGQVTKKWSLDEGTTKYLYTRDGLLRFSQNEVQRNTTPKRFSYTNYDHLDRVIESGEALEGNAANLRFPSDDTPNPNDVFISDYTILNEQKNFLNITDLEKVEPSYYVYEEVAPTSIYDPLVDVNSNYTQNLALLWGQISYSKNDNNTTIYNYDVFGRIDWTVQKINGLGSKTKDIVYNDRGEIEKVIFQKDNPNEYFEHRYTYDKSGRLTKAYTRMSPTASYAKEAEYYYYLHGPLKRVELAENLQGVDFIYNTLGYLKAINSPNLESTASGKFNDPGNDHLNSNGFEVDVFGMTLDYFSGDYARQGTNVNYSNNADNNYNGNIKSQRWNTKNQMAPSGQHWLYRYLYNDNNWLTEANFGTYTPSCQNSINGVCSVDPTLTFDANQEYKVTNITYDKVGNIQTLLRRATSGIIMDDFTYQYSTDKPNQLIHLNDAATSPGPGIDLNDLKDQDIVNNPYNPIDKSTWNYTYDKMGRMTEDKAQNHILIYNSFGLVKEVQKVINGGTFIPVVTYFYDEAGIRLSKVSYDQVNGNPVSKQWYAGGVKYDQDLSSAGNPILGIEYDISGSGRIGTLRRSLTTVEKTYELKDHLGNVRATVAKSLGGFELLSFSDYYPFGSEIPGRQFVGSGGKYDHKYQGQFTEHDEEVNWDAFELRNWDGRLARWTTIDPAGQYHSPYLGMGNNPINGVDPDGAWVKGAGFWKNIFQTDKTILSGYADNLGGYLTETSSGFTVNTPWTQSKSLMEDGTTLISYNDGGSVFYPKGRGMFSGIVDGALGNSTFTAEVSGNITIIGGFGFSIGVGRDSYGNWFDYSSVGPSYGLDVSIGATATKYYSYQNKKLRAGDLKGDGGEYEFGIGFIDAVSGGDLNRTFGPFGTLRNSGSNKYRSESFGGSLGSPIGFTYKSFNTSINFW